ncbi:MAG: hypothetical protein QM831_33680 [Kofleriaceae bacterium]
MKALLVAFAACAAPDVAPPSAPAIPAPVQDAALVSTLPPDAAIDAAPPPPAEPEVWLKGSTHVHAHASGDATDSNEAVAKWYEDRGYDFIVLTDHNRVSEFTAGADTHGQIAIRPADPANPHALIVLAGIELTHNPTGCLPIGDKSKKCRIHVNVLGPTARPGGKLEWAERHSHQRLDMYRAAINTAHALDGTLIQLNHPQWFWGMTGDLLAALAQQGVQLVEIANVQFDKWNKGDKDHPSTEQLWDDVLSRGITLWGIASDDAHDYPSPAHHHKMKWPAGGGWVVVKARRDGKAILDALAAGHFYSSTGVVLDRAEVDHDELVIQADPHGTYEIRWIENGVVVATDHGTSAHRAVPASGYLRADIVRDDGAMAWVEPVRR